MLITFLLGIAAGYVTPMAEPHVRRALEGVVLAKIDIARSEFDMLTLVLLLLAAALVTGGGSSLALLAGALLGLVGKRILARIQGKEGGA